MATVTAASISTFKRVGCGKIYMTLAYDSEFKPMYIKLSLGKAGGCAGSQLNGIQGLINLLIKSNLPLSEIYDKKLENSLYGIRCPEIMSDDEDLVKDYEEEEKVNLSCCDGIAKSIHKLEKQLQALKEEKKKK